jgi:predicted nucleic acid-binding protein
MILADLPTGSDIVIDSNILIYARGRLSAECENLLKRCARMEFVPAIATITLAEFCHRQMVYEAQAATALGSNPARRLASRPELVRTLTKYSAHVQELLNAGIRILTIESADFAAALKIQKDFGLLTNDSLIAATAIRQGIRSSSRQTQISTASHCSISTNPPTFESPPFQSRPFAVQSNL